MADLYVVIHLGTTLDETSTYPDISELISLSWCTVEATTLTALPSQTILVEPETSPVTPACLTRHNVTWEDLKSGNSFKDAIAEFDRKLREQVATKEFSFVTVDHNMLRVMLPREARDKGVVMPAYLQHPRVFDLINEYQKWQATHPEALSYPSSSLTNVITALGVESHAEWSEDKNNDISKVTDVLAAILVQLAKKSVPLEAHKLVLTKPYDSAQDAKTFLAERSKTLFLSNLPAETTQSELEQWFAQHGGRPVAFWTFKNIDTDAKNTQNGASYRQRNVCGFVVFTKHEEAAEALDLNGRVLNGRVVEVLASSTRVLERASELLTPFSSLKNRPRPGDWNCASCGFSNFQRRIACFRCSLPAASGVTLQEQMYNRSQNNALDLVLLRRHKSDENQSSPISSVYTEFYGQTLKNNSGYNNNNNNNTSGSIINNNTTSNGYSYSQMHGGNSQRMHYNNSVPFRAGDWKCTNEACHYHNFAKNLCCLKCGGAKPAYTANQMQPSSSGTHANYHNGANQANIYTVNTTSAAIATAAASGQPLNLNNGYGAHRTQSDRLPSQGSHPQQIPLQINGNGLYSNLEQLQQLQFKQQQQQLQQKTKPQGLGHLPQRMALLQGSAPGGTQNQKMQQECSLSAPNSPHLYEQKFHYKADNGNRGVSMLSNQINFLS